MDERYRLTSDIVLLWHRGALVLLLVVWQVRHQYRLAEGAPDRRRSRIVRIFSPLSLARGFVVPELAGVEAFCLETGNSSRLGVVSLEVVQARIVRIDKLVEPVGWFPVENQQSDRNQNRIPTPLHRRVDHQGDLATADH